MTAPTAGHTLEAFVQVPTMATNESQGRFAAIKLSSKLVGDKLEVTVSGLSGDATAIKSCKDWGALKESPIASYILGEGDQATVSQLSDLGPNFKNGRLTFKAITLKAAPVEDEFEPSADALPARMAWSAALTPGSVCNAQIVPGFVANK